MVDVTEQFVRTEVDRFGNRVSIYRTTGATSDNCAYCLDGNCEQEIHRSDAYGCDVIVHDRPAALN